MVQPVIGSQASCLNKLNRCMSGINYQPPVTSHRAWFKAAGLGPVLYTIRADSLLWLLVFPSDAFDDDIKFLANITVLTQHEVQTEVDNITNLSFENSMQLSLEKTILLHAGRHQPLHSYAIHGFVVNSVDHFMYLGVHLLSCAGYSVIARPWHVKPAGSQKPFGEPSI